MFNLKKIAYPVLLSLSLSVSYMPNVTAQEQPQASQPSSNEDDIDANSLNAMFIESVTTSGNKPLSLFNFNTGANDQVDMLSITKESALNYLPPSEEVAEVYQFFLDNDLHAGLSLVLTMQRVSQALSLQQQITN